MRARLTILLTTVLAAGLIATGCGDDDEETTTTGATGATGATGGGGSAGAGILPADFAADANAICREDQGELDAELEEAFGEGEPTDAEQEAFVTDVFVPKIREQIDELRALGEPDEGAEEYSQLLDEADGAVDEVEDDPSLFTDQTGGGRDPFEGVNELSGELGLTDCAG